MAKREKAKRPGRPSLTSRAADRGKAVLRMLAPSLQKRGVPAASYIIVNPVNGAFVTGKTPEQASQRFACMHPGVEGWMRRFADVIAEHRGKSHSHD